MAFDYIQFETSSTAIGLGTTGTISAAVYDSTTSAIDAEFEGLIVFSLTTSSVGSITIGTATATAAAGIATTAYTATGVGSFTIEAAYSTLATPSLSIIVHPKHLAITSSNAPLVRGNSLLIAAEVRNSTLAVDTADSTTSVSFTASGTGTVTGTGSATAVNGIASRLITGSGVGPFTISATATSVAPATQDLEVANSSLITTSGARGKWFSQSPFRITLWDTSGSGRGRGSVKEVISDAKYIGCSSYLNEGGEMFFTIPYNHPQIAECVPMERHYRVDRWDEEDAIYRTVGTGLLQDFSATDDEFVFYGIDYMTALNQTITDVSKAISGNTVIYNDKTFSSIFQSEMSAAKNIANSRLGFINIESTISPSTKTYDIFTAGENRGDFLFNMASIAQAGTTTKVVFGNRIETASQSYNSFFLDMNYATGTNNSLRLVYGGNVKRFSYTPNLKSLRTRAVVIATSIYNGVTPTKIWSNFATSTLSSTYGVIDRVDLQQDIIQQSAVSARAAFNLYESSPDKIKQISVSVVDASIIPYKNYKLGDDIRVIIKRGNINLNENLTVRGQTWVGREDGSEQITFDFFNPSTQRFEISPYREGSALQSVNRQNQQMRDAAAMTAPGDQGSSSTTLRSERPERRVVGVTGEENQGGNSAHDDGLTEFKPPFFYP